MVSDEAFNTIIDGAAMVIQRARAAEATVEAQKRTIEDLRRGTGKDTMERDVVTGLLEQACQLLERIVREGAITRSLQGDSLRSQTYELLETLKQDHPQLHLKP